MSIDCFLAGVKLRFYDFPRNAAVFTPGVLSGKGHWTTSEVMYCEAMYACEPS